MAYSCRAFQLAVFGGVNVVGVEIGNGDIALELEVVSRFTSIDTRKETGESLSLSCRELLVCNRQGTMMYTLPLMSYVRPKLPGGQA